MREEYVSDKVNFKNIFEKIGTAEIWMELARRLMKDIIIDEVGNRTQTAVEDTRIDALNRDFKNSGIEITQARLILEGIKKDLEKGLERSIGKVSLAVY